MKVRDRHGRHASANERIDQFFSSYFSSCLSSSVDAQRKGQVKLRGALRGFSTLACHIA